MKLILEAIKSLFRKLENRIPKSIADLLHGERISGDMVEDMYYTEPDRVTYILPEQTYETPELTADYKFVRDDVATYGCDVPGFNPAAVGITEESFDKVFTVVWDGMEYRCIAHNGGSLEMFVLGNANIADERRDDSGEPFCILIDLWWDYETKLYIRTNKPGAHTVSIGAVALGEVHQVPEKYIPVLPVEKGGTGVTTIEDVLSGMGFSASRYKSTNIINNDRYIITETDINAHTGAMFAIYFPTKYLNYIQSGTSTFVYLTAAGKNLSLWTADNKALGESDVSSGYHFFMVMEKRKAVMII